MKSKDELAKIRRKAIFVASINLAIGGGAMLFSLGEESFPWTFFVLLAGLEGIAIGLLAGVGYSQVLLDFIPPKWKMSPLPGFFWVILTFWAPIVVTFFFGTMMYNTLPDATLPRSKLNGDSGAGLMQSFVTFFNAIGCLWLMVYLVVRKVERSIEETDPGADSSPP